MKKHAAPIIAAILLLLPVLYVGSYLALVVPQGRWQAGRFRPPSAESPNGSTVHRLTRYRIDGELPSVLFYPLEQIDQKMRPEAWELDPPHIPIPSPP